jgi:hypothetical protein
LGALVNYFLALLVLNALFEPDVWSLLDLDSAPDAPFEPDV